VSRNRILVYGDKYLLETHPILRKQNRLRRKRRH
jgi:hypothetical protein